MRDHIVNAMNEAADVLSELKKNEQIFQQIEKAAERLIKVFESGGRVYSCGNGGSMCDAIHFAEELSGRFRKDRRPLAASAISDPGHISCVANDYGYEEVFSRYIEAHGRPGDMLMGISTSGTSKNIIRAAEEAKKRDMSVIALTGRPSALLGKHSDIEICSPGGEYADRCQELHIKIIHILIELVERRLFPDNYMR